MFKKKVKEELKEEPKAEPEEPEIINKTVPNPQMAVDYVRFMCQKWVAGLCNVPKQDRVDLLTCIDYLQEYIKPEIKVGGSIQEQIDDGTLGNYSRTYEDNGYEITLTIKKISKK